MRIIQLSDSHISRDHPMRAVELERCVEQINALDSPPDVVIHTGDVAHDGYAEEYAVARRVLDGLSAPYFVIPGNRDKRHELIKFFADGQYIQNGMEFVQYAVERFATRLIMIDTLADNSNKGRLCGARLAHLDRMLAADTTRPAALFMHHPPFEVRPAPDAFQFERWTDVEALATLLAKYSQLRGVYCGHVHQKCISTIGELPASTVICVATDLRKGTARAEDPSLPAFVSHSFA